MTGTGAVISSDGGGFARRLWVRFWMIVWTLAAIIALFVGSGLLITSFEPESLVASTGLFASGTLLICSSVYLLYTMW